MNKKDESRRLYDLLSYGVLDTSPDQELDEIAEIASLLCDTPISLISLVDENRQWFKSRVGMDTKETPREDAFCRYTLDKPDEILVIPDSLEDERFRNNRLVTGEPRIRFYAGAPLLTPQGNVLGTLCVIDRKPKELTENQAKALKLLAKRAMDFLNTRKLLIHQESELDKNAQRLKMLTDRAPGVIFQATMKTAGSFSFDFISEGMVAIHPDYTSDFIRKAPETLFKHAHPEDLEMVNASVQHSFKTLEDWDVEYRVANKDGITRWLRGTAVLEKKPDQQVVWYGTIQDITLDKEYETTLEKISFDISHVLRRPVTSLLGLVNLFDDLNDTHHEEKQQIISSIRTVSEEMESFTRKLNSIYYQKKSNFIKPPGIAALNKLQPPDPKL